MKFDERFMDRIRGFALLDRLSPQALNSLLETSAELQEFEPGGLVFSQGQSDGFISYLLEGRLERTRNGIFERVIDFDKDFRTRPLDAMAQKPCSLHAASNVKILRLIRRDLERAYLDAAPGERDPVMEVADLGTATTEDWRTRLLGSRLFATLAKPNVEQIFDRMQEIAVVKGQDVICQGEVEGDYYVVQTGTCEVLRNRSGVGPQIHVANLGPGDGFGEESGISGTPRNATVRMTTDGRVMKLARQDFLDLIVKPLVRGVSYTEALYLHAQGFVLVDAREPEQYRHATMLDAINLPGHLVRDRAGELDRAASYVICSDIVGNSMLCAFHFIERGLDAVYLEVPVNSFVTPPRAIASAQGAHPEPMDMDNGDNNDSDGGGRKDAPTLRAVPPLEDRRVPRDEFTDTVTGQELADIIDELYHHRKQMEEPERAHLEVPSTTSSDALVERVLDGAHSVSDLRIPESLIQDIVHEIDVKLTQYIKQSMAARQDAMVRKLKEHAVQIERVAQDKVKAHEAQMRAHFDQLFDEREAKLRADYERLAGLANRLAQQKAEIQLTRRRLAETLQAANRVHQAVYRAGSTLVSQVDHLAEMDNDASKS